MKKTIALVLAMMMVLCCFAFTGCADEPAGDDENKNAADATTDETTEENADEEADEEGLSTVVEGKLTMATNAYFKPYEYYEGDQIVGIDAEIAAAIADKLGLELEIKDMAFDSIITAVTEGSVDMGLAGMTVTDERLESVNFSISYASGVQSIIVKEGSDITSVDDLYADGAAQKIGVQLGTTGDIYCVDDFGEDRVTQYQTGNEAVSALIGGAVDCVIIDNEPAKSFVEANEGLVILETSYADEDYAACVAKENDDLLEAIDTAIYELIQDGTIDTIIGKYIKSE